MPGTDLLSTSVIQLPHKAWGIGANVGTLAAQCGAFAVLAFLLLVAAARMKRL